jgi:hypothetical protein
MLSKSIIALSAMLVVGAASSALADEVPENRIADRYPFLEQMSRSASTTAAPMRHVMLPHAARLDLYTNEVPEHKIADRYPFLDQSVRIAAAAKAAPRASRAATRFTFAEKANFDRQTARFVF